jgi:hypothetical protein
MDAIDLLHLKNRHHSGMARRSLGCIDDYSALHGCWEGADDDQSGGAQDSETGPNDVGGSGADGQGTSNNDSDSFSWGMSDKDDAEDVAGFDGDATATADGFSEWGGYGWSDQGYGAPGGPGFGGPTASDVGWGSWSPTAVKGPGALGVLDGVGIAANPITGLIGAGVKMGTGYSPMGWAGIGARSLADFLGIGPQDVGTMSGQPEGPEGAPANNSQPGSGYGNNPRNSDDGGYGSGPVNPVKILPALRSPLQEELLNRNRTTRFTGGPQGPWSGNLYEVPQPSLQRSLMRG